MSVPAAAQLSLEDAEKAEFNLDCIIAISSRAISDQAGSGISTNLARVGPLIVYFMGRYEGITGKNAGSALASRALEQVDVETLYPICIQAMDELDEAFALAEPGMDALEARIREEVAEQE